MLLAGPEVGDHDVAPHTGLFGGVHRPDRRIPVDGVGALRVAAAGARGPDERIVSRDLLGDLGRRALFDIEHDRSRAGLAHIVGMLRVAEEGRDLVPLLDEESRQPEGDLAVASDDGDA